MIHIYLGKYLSLKYNINSEYKEIEKFFVSNWILKWNNGDLFINHPLTRYQITLILYRLYKRWFLKIDYVGTNVNFKDIWNLVSDVEFMEALKFVVNNGILKWDNWYFFPANELTWEQFLAIIGRLWWKLSDGKDKWCEPYLKWAEYNWLIGENWPFYENQLVEWK